MTRTSWRTSANEASSENIAVFDRRARDYDSWFDENAYAYRSELEAVRELIPTHGRGVEIGVGTGRFSAPLGIEVGVEPAERMAAIARSRGIEVYPGVVEELPFANETFDFALLVTVICFVEDPAAMLEEVRRVLKPGGYLVIGFIDRDSTLGREYESKKDSSEFYGEARFYSALQVIQLLTDTGFEIATTRQTLYANPKELNAPEPTREGYGEGAFVVIHAVKRKEASD